MKNLTKLILLNLFLFGLLLVSSNAQAAIHTLDVALTGQKENPANASGALGALTGTYDDASNVLSFTLRFSGLSAPATAAHFHGPAGTATNASVQIGFAGFPTGSTSGVYSNTYTLTPVQESQLLCGMWYVNVHNSAFPGGEIRSQLTEGSTSGNIIHYDIPLIGQKEVPANASSAVGRFAGSFNQTTNVLSFTLQFTGLSAPATAAHLHAPATVLINAPVTIGFAGFPTGVTSGVYVNSYVLTATQKTNLLSGLMYVNIHDASFPGGEIRAQITEGTLLGNCAAVPTMSEWSLIIVSLISIAIGMVFIYRKQYSLAYAASNRKHKIPAPIFHKALFIKLLMICFTLAIVGLILSYFYFGELTLTDTIGTLLCSIVIAFIAQLVIASKLQEKR